MAGKWKTTEPLHRTQKAVKLRYKNTKWENFGKPLIGEFVWSEQENTWVEVCEGEDGIGLYKEDGWAVVGWR
jgi:hypothetical protein